MQFRPNPLNPIDISIKYRVDKRLPEFPKTLKWLESIGVKVQNTRFQKYLDSIDDDKNTIFLGEDQKEIKQQFNALREIDEINWIVESFKDTEITKNIKNLLNIFIKGSEFRGDDKSSCAGRNSTFHLRMAAYFARAKILTDVEIPWDVEANYKGRVIVLEAKRISSFKKISKRISEAKHQIQKNTKLENKKKKIFGIIAIDTYEFMFNSNIVNCYKNINDCTAKIRAYFQNLSNTSWVNKEKDKIKKNRSRIHLIWINSIIPCFLERENVYITRFQSIFVPVKSIFTPDGKYSQDLTDYLSLHFENHREKTA
jgi:hypothetical protein